MELDIADFVKFLLGLLETDKAIARESRAGQCPFCGGALHVADYPRKPRGIPADVEAEFVWRYSFCCATRGCRKRVTPLSVRFLARRVYVGAMVVIACLSRSARPPEPVVAVPRRTARRWAHWWQIVLPVSEWFNAARGVFLRQPELGILPSSLLTCFVTPAFFDSLLLLLKWLSPFEKSRLPMAA